MSVTQNRDQRLDVVKALAIIAMVAGHCGFPFTHFIYLFHMAVFFMASGYCFKEKNADDIFAACRFIKRKFVGLWVPYVFWTVVFLLLNNVFIRINVYTDNPKIVSYMRGDEGQLAGYASAASVCKYSLQALYFGTRTRMGGAFWFLETLMKVSVSYCIVYYLLRNVLRLNTRKAFAVQWMLSVVFLFSGYGCFLLRFNTAGLDRVLSYYILIHSGYTAKKYSLSTKKEVLRRIS
jgi:fucose 4-O-acetylase-like acetyltransferase